MCENSTPVWLPSQRKPPSGARSVIPTFVLLTPVSGLVGPWSTFSTASASALFSVRWKHVRCSSLCLVNSSASVSFPSTYTHRFRYSFPSVQVLRLRSRYAPTQGSSTQAHRLRSLDVLDLHSGGRLLEASPQYIGLASGVFDTTLVKVSFRDAPISWRTSAELQRVSLGCVANP